jgi:hypothetical protein
MVKWWVKQMEKFGWAASRNSLFHISVPVADVSQQSVFDRSGESDIAEFFSLFSFI